MDGEDDQKFYEGNQLRELRDNDDIFDASTKKESTYQAVLRVANQIFMLAVSIFMIIALILLAIIAHAVVTNSKCNCSSCDEELLQAIKNILAHTEVIIGNVQNNSQAIGDSQVMAQNSALMTQDSALKLKDIIRTLSNLKSASITTEVLTNDVLAAMKQLLRLQNASSVELKSCQDIRDNQPNSESGYYQINSQIVYCEMNELCGVGGGWTRLAYLDMSDSTVDCPNGLRLYESGGIRACGRSENKASCDSVKFPSLGVRYSQVCGRVVGYQYASNDAFVTGTSDVDTYYVDGVSITQGYPRTHIWTLASGLFENVTSTVNCPCNDPPGNTAGQLGSFIGDNYFCESGNPNSFWAKTFYSGDPLWDGKGCGAQELNCCAAAGLPWFYRNDLDASTDEIEIRICGNQNTNDEDTPVGFYEIYVK